MKVILSGGWGYNNIGDDLILSSTIVAIRNKFPNAKFEVLTYSKSDSVTHKGESVEISYSLHRVLDLNSTVYKYPLIDSGDRTFFTKVLSKVSTKLSESNLLHELVVRNGKIKKELESIFMDSDLFVMCGGGYFNERCDSKINSSLMELKLAQDLGLKTIVLGPTIGRIPQKYISKVKSCFNKTEFIVVRDESSKITLKDLGINAIVISDIAMSHWVVDRTDSEKICNVALVYTSGESSIKSTIVDALRKFKEKINSELNVKLVITRRWNKDFRSARLMSEELVKSGISSTIVLPSDHNVMEKEIVTCDVMISENLHGLIPAARNLIPIIAINDYPIDSPNEKKFRGFLKQIDCQDFKIDRNTDSSEIYDKLKFLNDNYNEFVSTFESHRESTKSQYFSTLDKLDIRS